MAASSTSAQAVGDAIRRTEEANRLQRERDQKLLEQMQREKGTSIEVAPLPEAQQPTDAGPCYEINALQLTGVTVLSPDEIGELEAVVVGECISLPDINQLIRRITNLYIRKGLITTRAFIPEQDLTSGTLEIFVLEGRIESIEESGEQNSVNKSSVNIGTAFPGLANGLLNLRDLEQGLDQINRLQSNNAQLRLDAGSEPGLSKVTIDNRPGSRASGSVSADNFDGDTKLNGRAGYDNGLGLNDFFALSVVKDTEFDPNHQYSESVSLFAVIPYGYWTFSGLGSYFQYRDSVDGLTLPLQTDGLSRTYRLEAQRTLYRTPKGRISVSTAVEHRQSRNYIEDIFIEASSPSLTQAELELSVTVPLAGGVMVSTLGVSRGVGWFGAEDDIDTDIESTPRSRSTSYQLASYYARDLQLGELVVGYKSSLGGQYSDDVLYSSRQMSITSYYSVRGLKGSVVAADRAAFWRNELAVTVPATGWNSIDESFAEALPNVGLRLFLAYDAGKVFEHVEQQEQLLTSWSVGLSGSWHGLQCDLVYSELLKEGDLTDSTDSPVTYAQFSWQL